MNSYFICSLYPYLLRLRFTRHNILNNFASLQFHILRRTVTEMKRKSFSVHDGLIDSVTLCTEIPFFLRYDVLPFAISYLVLYLSLYVVKDSYAELFVLILIPCVLLTQLVLFLVNQWSVKLRRLVGFREATDVMQCSHVHVVAGKNAGEDRIVPMIQTSSANDCNEFSLQTLKFQLWNAYFEFQKVKYSFDKDKNSFVALDYLTHGSVSQFLSLRGHDSKRSVDLSEHKWGKNEFEIPIPAFLDLYLEHLVAPFFVFQVVCLVLWYVDPLLASSTLFPCVYINPVEPSP